MAVVNKRCDTKPWIKSKKALIWILFAFYSCKQILAASASATACSSNHLFYLQMDISKCDVPLFRRTRISSNVHVALALSLSLSTLLLVFALSFTRSLFTTRTMMKSKYKAAEKKRMKRSRRCSICTMILRFQHARRRSFECRPLSHG